MVSKFHNFKLLIKFGSQLVNTETGELCGPNERGEILIRGPQVMKGYYKNPSANAQTFEDEWFVM